MFEFVESITIEASPADVWDYLADVESWWLASNPEHIYLEVLSPDSSIGLDTKIVFEERVAGINGQAQGTITQFDPGTQITWEGQAIYNYLGFSLEVHEGVSWLVKSDEQGTQLSAHVWAEFPSSLGGRFFEWYAKAILDVVDKDREHARQELQYLKSAIESRGQSAKDTSYQGAVSERYSVLRDIGEGLASTI